MIDLSAITDENVNEFEKKRKETLLPHEGTWVHNIPFFLVPVELVMGFRGATFSPEEFYNSDIWKDPSHWNAGFVKKGVVAIFVYGTWQRLEKYLYAERIAAVKSIQGYGNDVWKLAIQETERIAREKGCGYVWTTTFRKGEVKKWFESTEGGELNPKTMMVIRKNLK